MTLIPTSDTYTDTDTDEDTEPNTFMLIPPNQCDWTFTLTKYNDDLWHVIGRKLDDDEIINDHWQRNTFRIGSWSIVSMNDDIDMFF